MSRLLSDVKVLDLTRVAAGPWCTQLFADMGATVYKIERPEGGDDSRTFRPKVATGPADPDGSTAFFLALNRGKQSITIDISQPDGAALVLGLARQCDVLVENYKAGGLTKYGLDYDAVAEVNPNIIYCSITGFGQTGPYAARPAYDSILQASAGLMSLCGDPAGEPQRTALAIADLTTGYCAAVAVLGALYHRQATGEGQFIDTAMLDTSVALTAQYASAHLLTGEVPIRAGNRAPNTFPSGLFHTGDDDIMLVCGNDRQFANLCAILGMAELADDPQFHTNAQRRQNYESLTVRLNSGLIKRPSADWIELLEKAGVPSARINRIDQVFEDPQVVHRQLKVDVPHPGGETLSMVRSPLVFSRTPVEVRSAPSLGQHTDTVLVELLGCSSDRLSELRERKVV